MGNYHTERVNIWMENEFKLLKGFGVSHMVRSRGWFIHVYPATILLYGQVLNLARNKALSLAAVVWDVLYSRVFLHPNSVIINRYLGISFSICMKIYISA